MRGKTHRLSSPAISTMNSSIPEMRSSNTFCAFEGISVTLLAATTLRAISMIMTTQE